MSVLAADGEETGAPLSPKTPQRSRPASIDDFEGFEWPELLGLEELLLDSGQLTPNSRHRECPPELHQIPSDIPDDLARILKQSVDTDPFAGSNAEQDDESAAARSLSRDEVTTPTMTASSLDGRSASGRISPFDLSKQSTKGSYDAPTQLFSQFSFSNAGRNTSGRNNSVSTSSQSKGSTSTRRSTLGRLSLKTSSDGISIKSRMKERFTFRECSSCLDEVMDRNLLGLKCGHKYCLTCFLNMVNTAMEDENKFPPKCCLVEIPMKMVLQNLDRAKREVYKLKMKEFSTDGEQRWYCPYPTCQKWIPPKKIKDGATTQKCSHCRKWLCSTCRGSAHESFETCPGMYLHKGRAFSVESHGCRRCHRCHSRIELVMGSDHMVCECGEEYCCICGARNGMCDCLEVDDQRPFLGPPKEKFLGASSIDELAATIAQIEHFEKDKVEEQQRRDSEQKVQEEQDRLREEEAREKESQRLLLISEKMQELRSILVRVNGEQQSTLTSRHQDSAQSIQSICAERQVSYEKWKARLEVAYKSNLRRRKTDQAAKQSTELLELKAHHEDEEDETFINTQRYLKGKPNREEREQSILRKLKRAHQRERVALEKAQRDSTKELDFETGMEGIALQAGMSKNLRAIHEGTSHSLYDLSSTVLSDRRWFVVVMAKRFKLLEQYRVLLVKGDEEEEGMKAETKSSSDHSHHSRQSRSDDERELDVLHENEVFEKPATSSPPLLERAIGRFNDTAKSVGGSLGRETKSPDGRRPSRSPLMVFVN